MTLEQLHQEWSKDSQLPTDQLDKAIRDVPVLHSRWWQIYTTERQRFMLHKQTHDETYHARREWYLGRMDDEQRTARNWPLQHLRLVRQDVDAALAGDDVIRPLAQKLELAELKLKFIEDVIKAINFRSSLIKNYIDYLRFSQGQ